MKILILLVIIGSNFSFAGAAVNDEFKQELVSVVYNKKIQDIESLVQYISQKDNKKSGELKLFLASHHISEKIKLPQIVVKNKHFVFNGEMKDFALVPLESGALKLYYKNKFVKELKISMSVEEINKMMIDLTTQTKITSMIELILPSAQAEGVGEVVGMTVSYVGAMAVLGTMYALDYVNGFASEIAKLPDGLREKSIRKAAVSACEDIESGKKVDGVEKLMTKVEALKKKVDCVPYWESYMEYSCKWFDEKIACLASGSNKTFDGQRNSVKSLPSEKSSGGRESSNSIQK